MSQISREITSRLHLLDYAAFPLVSLVKLPALSRGASVVNASGTCLRLKATARHAAPKPTHLRSKSYGAVACRHSSPCFRTGRILAKASELYDQFGLLQLNI